MNAVARPGAWFGGDANPGCSSSGSGCPPIAELRSCLGQLAPLHARLCPRQVLGVRLGLRAGEVLGLEVPRRDERLLVLVETDGCFADGVSVATGCWLGRRTLRLVDYGRVAATIVDSATEQAVRIRPHPNARVRALAWAPDAPDRWHAQLDGYQRMPDNELLCVEPVVLERPLLRCLIGEAGLRASCSVCGEEVLNGRELPGATGPMCRGCAAEPYYRVGAAEMSVPRPVHGWPAPQPSRPPPSDRDRVTPAEERALRAC